MKNIVLLTFFFSCSCFAQFYLEEDFNQYISGQQLVCQNPIDWLTWSNIPCDPWEDPFLSSTHSISYPNSLKIEYHNNLIKLLGNQSTGKNHITIYAYLPNGKSGKISLFSKFNPDPSELAFECFFDVGGTGRLMSIPGEPVLFNYTYNQWHLIWVVVDFIRDEAQFWIDHNLIHIWKWTQNGTITSQLAAQNFSGPNASDEIYFDDYFLFEGNCLQCLPPGVPTNLVVQQIFYVEPIVQLDWQHGPFMPPLEYEIIRKNGPPSYSTLYEHLDYVPFSNPQYLDSNIVIDSTYTYGVIALNEYGYSDTSNFATITVEPLPVELVSFTVDEINNNVQLNWSTATEINNSGFEIERKESGVRSRESEWNSIGFVQGHGTTTEPQFYSFIDETLPSGEHQYRLKQIDYDGSFEYSKIVEVIIEGPRDFSLSQNYPNPFNPSTKIKYTIPYVETHSDASLLVTLKVYDVLGNEVATLVNEEKTPGEYEVEFDGINLPSGIYFYHLKAGDFIQTRKMILLK
jgi:hypothetical protein